MNGDLIVPERSDISLVGRLIPISGDILRRPSTQDELVTVKRSNWNIKTSKNFHHILLNILDVSCPQRRHMGDLFIRQSSWKASRFSSAGGRSAKPNSGPCVHWPATAAHKMSEY